MSFTKALARRRGVVPRCLRMVLSAGVVAAGVTTTEAQMTEAYEFGSGVLQYPTDVAVAANCGYPDFVAVADPQVGLVIFDNDGLASNPKFGGSWCDEVAVNDVPQHVNYGQVYALGNDVRVYNSNAVDLMTFVLTDVIDPTGIAVDYEGNVYVSDGFGQKVVKYASSVFENPSGTRSASPALVIDTSQGTWKGDALDVSVDPAGRIAVPLTCGCFAVYHQDGSYAASGVPAGSGWQGCDARDAYGRMWAIDNNGVRQWTYDWQTEISGWPTVVSGTGPLGLESQSYRFYWYSPEEPIGYERLFVADPIKKRVVVYEQVLDSAPLPLEAKAWWTFNNVAMDRIGNNDGLPGGANPPGVVEGPVGCGATFTGTSSYYQVPDAPEINFGTGDYSAEGWIQAENQPSVQSILDKRDGTAGYAVFLMNGYLGVQVMTGGSWRNYHPQVASNFVADGAWHHFAVVMDRTSSSPAMRLYVDGVDVGSLAPLQGSVDNSEPLLIAKHSTNNNDLHGALDELTLYAKALTEAEVQEIHAARVAGKVVGLPDKGMLFSLKADHNVNGVATKAGDLLYMDPGASSPVPEVVYRSSNDLAGQPNIDAVSYLDSRWLLLSFDQDVIIPGMLGGPEGDVLRDEDLVRYIPNSMGIDSTGQFGFAFDGSTAGLMTDVDGCHGMDRLGFDLLLSMTAVETLGSLTLRDQDIGRYRLGWSKFFRGGAPTVKLRGRGEDIDGFSRGPYRFPLGGAQIPFGGGGGVGVPQVGVVIGSPWHSLYVTTRGDFNVPSLAGEDHDVLKIDGQMGTSPTGLLSLWLDGANVGLGATDIDALHILQ